MVHIIYGFIIFSISIIWAIDALQQRGWIKYYRDEADEAHAHFIKAVKKIQRLEKAAQRSKSRTERRK